MWKHVALLALLAGCAASMAVPSRYAGKTALRVRLHASMRLSLCEFRMVAEDDSGSQDNWLSGKLAPGDTIDLKVKPQVYKAKIRGCDDNWKASVTVDASESTEIVVMDQIDGKPPKWTRNYVEKGFDAAAFAWVKFTLHPKREVAAPTSSGSSLDSGGSPGEAPAENGETAAPAEEEQACTPDGVQPPEDRERYCCSKKTYPCTNGGAGCGYICCSSGNECH